MMKKANALTMRGFREELEKLINKYSLEQYSNTPDYILADILTQAFETWNICVAGRDRSRSNGYRSGIN